MTDYRNTVIYADVRDGLGKLKQAGVVVNACVTSPPYWALRSYLDANDPNKSLELGQESTPEEFVANLVEVFRLCRDILAPDGTLHIVIGDSYMGTGGPGTDFEALKKGNQARFVNPSRKVHANIKSKDLCLVPFELAKALRDDGWYLRSINIWAKAISSQNEMLNMIQEMLGWDIGISVSDVPVGSCMPQSAKDRTTVSHEYVLMLSKGEEYFWDQKAVKEIALHAGESVVLGSKSLSKAQATGGSKPFSGNACKDRMLVSGTRNRRSVAFLPTRAFLGQHFAAYPGELIEPIIQAATSQYGHCPVCHRGYRRIIRKGQPIEEQRAACGADSRGEYHGEAQKDYEPTRAQNPSEVKARILEGMRERMTVGWQPTCKCGYLPGGLEPVRGLVLDPFMGSGTTAQVAERLGRHWVGIELNEQYRPLIEERTAQMGLFT